MAKPKLKCNIEISDRDKHQNAVVSAIEADLHLMFHPDEEVQEVVRKRLEKWYTYGSRSDVG